MQTGFLPIARKQQHMFTQSFSQSVSQSGQAITGGTARHTLTRTDAATHSHSHTCSFRSHIYNYVCCMDGLAMRVYLCTCTNNHLSSERGEFVWLARTALSHTQTHNNIFTHSHAYSHTHICIHGEATKEYCTN